MTPPMHRRFNFLLVVRIALLVGTIFALAFVAGRKELLVNHFILSIVVVAQVVELIRFVNRTNRDLARLFTSIAHGDFSVAFPQGAYGKSFRALEESLNNIVNAYKVVKIEREAQYQLLQRLIAQMNIGIMAIRNNEELSLINPTAETLLDVRGIRNWNLLLQMKPEFRQHIDSMGDSGRKLVEWNSAGDTRMLSIDVSTTHLLDQTHKLVIIQDINSEIEQKEIEAWHKLIRILTHEIMNSVTPISSLAETTQGMLQNKEGEARTVNELNDEVIRDIVFSLNTIQKRTDGLLSFVDHYRALSRVPKPALETIDVAEVIHTVVRLMREQLSEHNIVLKTELKTTASQIRIDRSLVEQVLINLLSNSMHALEGRSNPQIVITASDDGNNLVIEVQDNGKGIPEKELPHIFVPFFSTRKEGSGIGLSLSKQIMASHGGTIKVRSTVDEGTSFFLRFRRN